YEEWSAMTTNIRGTATKAKAELKRRGLAQQPAEQQPEPTRESQSVAGWWQQFEADIAAVDAALDREHQAAISAGNPWLLQPDHVPQASLAVDPQPEGQGALLDELLGRASDAAGRLAADRADREAREYAAHTEREARAEPQPIRQPQ